MKTPNHDIPFSIKELKINNFHGVKDLSIELDNVPQWIFLTGENGFGKTSVLQAIATGFLGGVDRQNTLIDDKESIEIKINSNNEIQTNFASLTEEFIEINSLTQIHRKFERKTNDSKEFKDFLNFAAYGSSRLNKQSGKIDFSRKESSPTYSLRKTDGQLFNIEWELKLWYRRKDEKYQQIKKLILELLHPYVDDVDVVLNPPYKTVKYHEKDSPKDIWISYDEMASGYKNIVAMFGDMIIRLKQHSKNEIKSLSDISGIVLIDEIDLHLHPKWQKALVEKLTELFPKVQFIVSTHSPIPLLGAPENSIVLNVQRSIEEGITVEKLDVDLSELPPENILSSPIFDFQDIFPSTHKEGERIRTEKGYDEVVFNKILEKKLQKIAE